ERIQKAIAPGRVVELGGELLRPIVDDGGLAAAPDLPEQLPDDGGGPRPRVPHQPEMAALIVPPNAHESPLWIPGDESLPETQRIERYDADAIGAGPSVERGARDERGPAGDRADPERQPWCQT